MTHLLSNQAIWRKTGVQNYVSQGPPISKKFGLSDNLQHTKDTKRIEKVQTKLKTYLNIPKPYVYVHWSPSYHPMQHYIL